MKKLKLLPCAIILAVFMFSLSAFNNSKEAQLTSDPTLSIIEEQNPPLEVLITWVKGTKESDKQEYRDYYRNNNILLSWYQCEDPDKETWKIDCDNPNYDCENAEQDDPVNRKKPKSCCVQGRAYNANCKD